MCTVPVYVHVLSCTMFNPKQTLQNCTYSKLSLWQRSLWSCGMLGYSLESKEADWSASHGITKKLTGQLVMG